MHLVSVTRMPRSLLLGCMPEGEAQEQLQLDALPDATSGISIVVSDVH